MPMTPEEERKAIDQVAHRLASHFHDLSPQIVSNTVHRVHDQFATSRIRDYIPLLVERDARDRLRTASEH